MIDIKNKDFLLSFVSCIVIISVITIKRIQNTRTTPKKVKAKKISILPNDNHIKWVQTRPRLPAYNYNNMLNLLKMHRKIEKSFYANFEKFVKESKNIQTAETTLAKFKKEKKLFYRHLKKMNSLYKSKFTTRKNNALRYYLRTIETCINELEDIIEKFNISLK